MDCGLPRFVSVSSLTATLANPQLKANEVANIAFHEVSDMGILQSR